MNYSLLIDPSDIARQLGIHSAQERTNRAREARKAFHRAMRERLGLEPRDALR